MNGDKKQNCFSFQANSTQKLCANTIPPKPFVPQITQPAIIQSRPKAGVSIMVNPSLYFKNKYKYLSCNRIPFLRQRISSPHPYATS